jgi:hypothetical protein
MGQLISVFESFVTTAASLRGLSDLRVQGLFQYRGDPANQDGSSAQQDSTSENAEFAEPPRTRRSPCSRSFQYRGYPIQDQTFNSETTGFADPSVPLTPA